MQELLAKLQHSLRAVASQHIPVDPAHLNACFSLYEGEAQVKTDEGEDKVLPILIIVAETDNKEKFSVALSELEGDSDANYFPNLSAFIKAVKKDLPQPPKEEEEVKDGGEG